MDKPISQETRRTVAGLVKQARDEMPTDSPPASSAVVRWEDADRLIRETETGLGQFRGAIAAGRATPDSMLAYLSRQYCAILSKNSAEHPVREDVRVQRIEDEIDKLTGRTN